jgi:hypothetical protein
MLDKNIWQPINNNSTGYVGKHRNEEWAKRDAKYKEKWCQKNGVNSILNKKSKN